MALTIFPLWSQQWTDDNGDPLAGGLVYSYETGTSTPSPLFHDVEGTTEWDNPIELGSDGRFTDNVFQAVTPALDISVHDANDVPIANLALLGPIQAYAAAEEPPPPCTPVAITQQPIDQSVSTGDSATVSVVASGTAPITYQWYLGSSGNTSSPILGAVGTAYTTLALGAGVYTGWVRCMNDCGTADSLTVTVTAS